MVTNTNPTGLMSNLSLETAISEDETVSLTEGKNFLEENLKLGGLVSYIEGRFTRSKDARRQDEERWLRCYRNFRGIYSSDTQFLSTEKSRAFIKITKTKVLAAYNHVVDILLSGNKFPIGVEPANLPIELAESVHFDPADQTKTGGPGGAPAPGGMPGTITRESIFEKVKGPVKKSLERVKDKLEEGPGLTPTSLTWEPALIAARKMDKKFHDQLTEANAATSLRAVIFEMALFGHGIYKGPFAKDKEYPFWSETGEYQPKVRSIADFDHVSIWDSYPDPEARNMIEAEEFIQRHRMSKTQIRALKKRPFFREKSIEEAIKQDFNYTEEYWEADLKDYRTDVTSERFEVLEFWGIVDKDFSEITELEIPAKYKNKDQVQINAWICNGQLLRVVFNPFTPARIPYYGVPYEHNPYSFFGIGVAENMEDTQLQMNGSWRMMVDNAVMASNVVFEVNENNLVAGQDLDMYPGKIIRTNSQLGQSIHDIKFDNHIQENMMVFDKARQLADEATGIPSYSHGQGGVQGIGRTASGMSMLMGAAKENDKAVVRNVDDFLLVPLGNALFEYNMQFEFDKDFIGDVVVVARGTESLMRNEIRSQKILQFLQVTGNPMDAPYVKRDYLLRELAESLDLQSEKCVNDLREAGIQASVMKDLQIAQGIDPNAAQPGAGGQNPPPIQDPTGNGGGQIQPGAAPPPGAAGFSGGGGGDNGGMKGRPQK